METQVIEARRDTAIAPELPSTGGLGVVPALIWAFRIRDDGSAESLPVDAPISGRHDGWLWLHFNLADTRASEWLKAAALPEPALAMLLSRDRHQQLHVTASSVYGIIADFVKQVEGSGDAVGHLRFAMTERLLVSG